MGELVAIPHDKPVDAFRQSTDAAGLCGAIVKQTAKPIQGRRYVSVEGWQAIAIAHGCAASADHVERVNDEGLSGYKAIGIVRRMSDGAEIARAEGFLGDDEGMWNKRPVYARRAMVQTRAISRACRSAFAHVVVMIDAGLSTTPAEEVPHDGFTDAPTVDAVVEEAPARTPGRNFAPREKLEGPYSSGSALQEAIRRFAAELLAIEDIGSFNSMMEAPETVALEKQAMRYLPGWWETGEGCAKDFEPMLSRIARKKRDLEQIDELVTASGVRNVAAG